MHRAVLLGGALVLLGVLLGAVVAEPSNARETAAIVGGTVALALVIVALGTWPRGPRDS